MATRVNRIKFDDSIHLWHKRLQIEDMNVTEMIAALPGSKTKNEILRARTDESQKKEVKLVATLMGLDEADVIRMSCKTFCREKLARIGDLANAA